MTTEEPVTGQTHNLELHETVTFSDQVFAQHSVPTLAALVDASTDVIAQKLRQAGWVISTRSVERTIAYFGLQKKTLRA